MVNSIKEQTIKLRDLMNVSLVTCHKMLKTANGNFEEAQKLIQQYLNEGGQRYNTNITASLKYGKVIADVNADGTTGILLSVSCLSDAAAHSEIFNTLVDDLSIIAFNEKPKTACQLLGSSIDCLKVTFNNDILLKNANDVEELIQNIKDKLREPINIEDFLLMEVDKTQGSYLSIYPYNHLNGKRASLCSFFTSEKSLNKDLEWLKRSITASVAAYNPLCVHDSSMPQSIINYVTLKEKEELTLTSDIVDKKDEEVLNKMIGWKLNGFLEENVLDRIKILSEPMQDNTPLENRAVIPLKSAKEVYEMHGIIPMDFECFQLKIVNTL